MQIETLAIVRPPTTGNQELASRLSKGFRDASHSVAVYSSPEVCALAAEDLSNTTLVVASPGQCMEASGDESVFLSKVACARKRILASVGPVHSPGYLGRLRRGIHFDAVFDLGFASQSDNHSEVSDVPYHFVFNGLTREEEPFATESAHTVERTIPWALVGPRNQRHLELLAELFEHKVDPQSRRLVAQGSRRFCRKRSISYGVGTVASRTMKASTLSTRYWQGPCPVR
jgi:hypothetical protein